jgi:DNA-binding GntR family transcriptional regulator
MRKYQYIQIFDDLKSEIQTGKYIEGEMLPSEYELVARFQTSRMTVRQALAELVKEGFIERVHGKGSVVKTQTKKLGLLNFKGFSEVVQGARTTEVKKPSRIKWPDPFFFELTPFENTKSCVFMERLRLRESEPLMLEFTYFVDKLDKVLNNELVDGSLFKSLKIWYDIEVISLQQSISAITSDEQIAKIMNIKPGKPLVYVERKYKTNHEDLFLYSALYCNTEKYALFAEY